MNQNKGRYTITVMSISKYLYEKVFVIIINIFAAIALCTYLRALAMPVPTLIYILIAWTVILLFSGSIDYAHQKKKIKKLENQLASIEQKYLISEVIDLPETQLEAAYYHILKQGNKGMLEAIGELRDSQRDYKEYIEEWIHEIKTPITAIDLICNNHSSEETKRIQREMKEVHYLVEQALFYARSETVEKDYFIKKTRLFDCVQTVLLRHRTEILEKKIALEVEESEEIVYTDAKWVTFILHQVLANAIQYQKEENRKIKIYSENLTEGLALIIEDNGIGICASDLKRVYEKGFTGSNRAKSKSTGIGLYLCKKLCDKLGISIRIESKEGTYTRVIVAFPIGTLTIL